MKIAVVFLLILIFPVVTQAAVTINEVAWMGSVDSANYEWIELLNDSSASVIVDDWELTDGMNLVIPLSGGIAANSYAVLERTSDDSAPGTAFLIYTGALVNTGATLSLKRADGSIEDQVAGGEDWGSIGGDNVTKETAQYTTSGWITAAPTPGNTNKEVGSVNTSVSESSTSQGNSNGVSVKKKAASVSEPVQLVLPDVTLQLEVSGQTVGYVNQTINFSVEASGVGDNLINSLRYEWNFGDGTTAVGKEPEHSYLYPGTYVATAYGSYKRQEQIARHEITVLPVTISITRNSKGDVQINNDSPYEIDISGYEVRAGKTFVFPARSVMLPNQTITLPLKKVGYAIASVLDATGAIVVSENTDKEIINENKIVQRTMPITSTEFVTNKNSQNFNFATTAAESVASPTNPVSYDANPASLEQSSSNIPPNTLPYLGLIGVIAVGAIGVLVKPDRNQIE